MAKSTISIAIAEDRIINKIYLIRGKKVMLDKDLAELYGVETRVLNQAVRRNEKRFSVDFMFQLTVGEFKNLISQNVTSSWGGIRKQPLAFTEQGVAMLSSIYTFFCPGSSTPGSLYRICTASSPKFAPTGFQRSMQTHV